MAHIKMLSQFTDNKVHVAIQTNSYNESMVFAVVNKVDDIPRFSHFDDILTMFKGLRVLNFKPIVRDTHIPDTHIPQTKQRNNERVVSSNYHMNNDTYTTTTTKHTCLSSGHQKNTSTSSHQYQHHERNKIDQVFYMLMASTIHPDLSLFASDQIKLKHRLEKIKEEIVSSPDIITLKKLKIKDVFSLFSTQEPKRKLVEYISLLHNKNIAIRFEDTWEFYPSQTSIQNDMYSKINVETSSFDICQDNFNDFKRETIKSQVENLNTLLVHDLKQIAKTIGVATSVIDAGKRRYLLKSELLQAIKSVLK